MSRSRLPALLALTVLAVSSPALPAEPPAPAPGATPAPPPTPSGGEAPGSAAAPPEASPAPPPDCLARSLDAAERDTLLRLAWRTLAGHLTDQPITDADLQSYTFTPCLMAKRGLFITLRKDGQVRGLQGEVDAKRPLYQEVIVFTRRAATRDPRFLPLTERDLASLVIEMALIGERRKVGGPADIRLDADGIYLEKWGRAAVFLPGEAARQKWTAERTLDELCAQAALPKGSWSDGATIEVFGTEVVSGGPPAASPEEPSGAARTTAERSTT